MKYIFYISILLSFTHIILPAQGPPITSDNPIMVGSNRTEIRTLFEYRDMDDADYLYMPLTVTHTFGKDFLLGVRLPMMSRMSSVTDNIDAKTGLADIQLIGKYQFYRRDRTGKTLRMVIKAVENLPTGAFENVHMLSMQEFQTYKALIVGYETLKYGISNELGINYVPGNNNHDIRYNLSFGLPLLEPIYPTRQLNLFFDYSTVWEFNTDHIVLLYTQGVQYAIDNATFEIAFQLPLYQNSFGHADRNYSLYAGSRLIF